MTPSSTSVQGRNERAWRVGRNERTCGARPRMSFRKVVPMTVWRAVARATIALATASTSTVYCESRMSSRISCICRCIEVTKAYIGKGRLMFSSTGLIRQVFDRAWTDAPDRQGRRGLPAAQTLSSDSAQSNPSALPTPCTRLNSGCGTIPKKIVAAPASTATKATSG